MALPQWLWSPCLGDSLQLSRLPCSSRTVVRRLQVTCRAQGVKRAAATTATVKKENKTEGRRNRRPADQEEDDGSEVVMNMKAWVKNKPPGFGVGKEYDTSLEDQILVDIDREEKLRAEAEVRRKEEQEAKKKKELEEKRKAALKKPEPPDGVRVKVKYLPRKKNIERDLRLLLKNVRGLLHIRPNELGNSKTKDPVCKGNAVLTFIDEQNALSFIEKHQGQKFAFGKVEKKLGFELQKSKDSSQQKQVATGPHLRTAEKAKPALADGSEDVDDSAVEGSEGSPVEDEYATDSEDSVAVQDSLADAILDTEEDGTVSEGAEEESSEEDDGFIFRVPESVLKVAKELDEEEEEDSSYSDDEDELIVEDGEEKEEESGGELDSLLSAGNCLEVEMSLPKMDIEEREEILKTSQGRIAELDEQIGKLIKKLKRKPTKKLEQEITKLREEKIELLEKRILAKVLAGQEAYRRKREKRKQLQAQTDRNRRKLLPDVLSQRSK